MTVGTEIFWQGYLTHFPRHCLQGTGTPCLNEFATVYIEKIMNKLLAGLALAFAANSVYAADNASVYKYVVIDGSSVYNTGKPLSCAYCHGKDGAGFPKTQKSRQVPAIAGLPSKTTEALLRANKRGYVKDGIKKMHDRSSILSDDEIVAVAKYIESLTLNRKEMESQ